MLGRAMMMNHQARRLVTSTKQAPDLDILIVGGGVVGLAVARALGEHFKGTKSIYVVEREKQFGQGVSSRNSEVMHAGIYYPKNSNKAKWCVEGRRLLKAYCEERSIPFDQCGKLIVASTSEQSAGLQKVIASAQANGVGEVEGEALELIDGAAARKMEPELQCHSAVFSPATGIIDSHAYMESLELDALGYGVEFVYNTKFMSAILNPRTSNFEVTLRGASSKAKGYYMMCGSIINCAGLFAPIVARNIQTGVPTHDSAIPEAFYCKGNYFKTEGVRNPFSRLIYPLPEAHGLGVHLTIDLQGHARFGPDVEWIDGLENPEAKTYEVDPKRAESFYASIRKYWPGLPDGCLVPDYAGIRPKLGPANVPAFDFTVMTDKNHGVKNLVHALGIESPGLTSSLAIANHIKSVALGFD